VSQQTTLGAAGKQKLQPLAGSDAAAVDDDADEVTCAVTAAVAVSVIYHCRGAECVSHNNVAETAMVQQ